MEHYHLIGGLIGLYLPNMSEVYISLEDAKLALKDLVEEEIDDMVCAGIPERQAENNVTWSRDLLYVTLKHGGNECYEIIECDDEDCLEPVDLEP